MAWELLPELGPGDLLMLYRGYPGYQMFHAVITQRTDFLVSLPKDGLFQEARAFLARGKRDGKITVSPPKNRSEKIPTTIIRPPPHFLTAIHKLVFADLPSGVTSF